MKFKGSENMFKHLKINRLKIVVLSLSFLILLSACTAVSPEDQSPDPGTNPPATSTISPTDPAEKPDVSKPETGDTRAEDILKDYERGYAVIDAPIEDFELEDLEGNKVRLSDLEGKYVFLNFWATWCPPCRDEMPHMQTFYEKYKDEGVVILGVNPNQVENQGVDNAERAEEKAREFIDDNGFTFPILLDRDDSVWAIYQQRGIPANYMIDKEGTVKYLKPGAFSSLEEMEAFLEALKLSTN
ncbi:MAG: TlpA family protein disulfide reductase [Clostridiales bacterium]|nr:TlpA family protein disulfide reductase [Clostridiales bacterium]